MQVLAQAHGKAAEAGLRLLAEHGLPIPDPEPGEDAERWGDRLETALLELFARSGRPEAFEALHAHARPVLEPWVRWLARQQHSRVDTVDLVQDTFVNVFRYAKSFRPREGRGFRPWARTIAANLLRRARSRGPEARLPMLSLQALPAGLQEPRDPEGGPQAHVSRAEESRSLGTAWLLLLERYARAYELLAARDRLALDLVEVRGCSYAEAAAELGVGASNMKMIMLRARRRLLKQLRGVLETRPPALLRAG